MAGPTISDTRTPIGEVLKIPAPQGDRARRERRSLTGRVTRAAYDRGLTREHL